MNYNERLEELERKARLQHYINFTLSFTVICFSITNILLLLKFIF